VQEKPLLDLIVRTIQEQYLNPDNLEGLRAELRRQAQEAKSEGGELGRVRRRLAELAGHIDQGNRNMALAPDAAALRGIARAVQGWEAERVRLTREAERLGRAIEDVEETLRLAEQHLWRLRESVQSADPADVRAVLREVVDRVELFFTHRPWGRGRRTLSAFDHGVIHLALGGGSSDLFIRGR
jgi:hypothetical protein